MEGFFLSDSKEKLRVKLLEVIFSASINKGDLRL